MLQNDALLRMWPQFQIQFGEAVTYTPSGGVATSITAVIQRGSIEKDWEAPVRVTEESSRIIFDSDDVSSVTIGSDKVTDSAGNVYVLAGITRKYGTIVAGEIRRGETSAIGVTTQGGY
jgi:hypothetical protein